MRFPRSPLALLLIACSGSTSNIDDSGGGAAGDDTGPGGTTDSGTPANPACPEDVVTFTSNSGAVQDLTDFFISGDYVTLAVPGTLEVCPGTWFARVLLRSNITVRGLGELPRDTILSGGESGTILDIAGPNVSVTVENLRLDRGAGLDVDHNSGGGGIYCEQEGVLLVQDVIFTDNFANDGSAIYTRECEVDIKRATMKENYSEDDGGAATFWYSTVTLDEVTIQDNEGLDGGGMAIFSSDVTATNTTVSDNQAGNFGGGIWVHDSTVHFSDMTISGNNNDGGDYGGGLIVFGDATLDRVTITDNSAALGGGLFVYYESIVEGTDCNFSGNFPEDIFAADYSTEGGTSYDAGSGYSFSCADNACSAN